MNKDENTPVISNSLSARVLFPWSMCAIMEKFLILSTGNLERSMDSLKKRMAGNEFVVLMFVLLLHMREELIWEKIVSRTKTPTFSTPNATKC